MAEVIFVICTLLYLLIATKLDEWQTIQRLGFPSGTPEYYLQKPQYYHYVSWVFFWSAAISCFWISIIPWPWGVLVLLASFFLTGMIGHSKGIRTYRHILAELLELEDDEEQRERIRQDLNKSNSEILSDQRIAV